jgi:hypothetical protein
MAELMQALAPGDGSYAVRQGSLVQVRLGMVTEGHVC